MPVREASAEWKGDLAQGSGTMSTGSGSFKGAYSFGSRFEEGSGTNPEELIAAAHAGCFSMALSGGLTRAGYPPNRVRTTARVHLDKGESGYTITTIHLSTEADVPGIEEGEFQDQARQAKAGCPVSRLVTGATIELDAKLVT